MNHIPTPPAFSVCIYCASRPGTDPACAAMAAQIGQWIGQHGGQLVYGGGRAGLMGILADAALNAGARVVGIIPRALVDREHAHRGCTELQVVETMHERKRLMSERADFFLTLPGGIGTFEEFFETWSWRQLGYHDKPIGLLNFGGYYDDLLRFLRQCVASGFMSDAQLQSVAIGADGPALLDQLLGASGRSAAALKSAIHTP